MGQLDDLAKPSSGNGLTSLDLMAAGPSAVGASSGTHLHANVAPLFDLLDRARQAVQAGIAGKNVGSALVHGVSHDESDANRSHLRDVLRLSGAYGKMPHLAQGAVDTGLDMLSDPTTYLGGAGVFRKGVQAAGEHALPAVMRLAEQAAKKAPLGVANDAMGVVTKDFGRLHDFLTPGGKNVAHANRELARREGSEGVRQSQRLYAMKNAAAATQGHLEGTLRSMYDSAIRGLTPQQETRVYRALHYGRIAKLPQELQAPARQLEQVTRSVAYLRGSGPLRKKLEGMGFELPQPLRSFDRGPLGVQNAKQFRENYLPLAHELDDAERASVLKSIDKKRIGGKDFADISDKRLRKRASDEARILSDPELYREAFKGAIRSGARSTAAAELRRNVAQQFGNAAGKLNRKLGEVPDSFKSAALQQGETESGRAIQKLAPQLQQAGKLNTRASQRWASVPKYIKKALTTEGKTIDPSMIGYAQELGNLGKASLFTTPFPHMKNILTLLGVADPAAIPDAFKTYAQLHAGFAGPSRTHEVLQDAVRAGASGVPNVEESKFLKLIKNAGDTVQKKAGKVAAAPLRGAEKLYDTSGKALWGFDDAAKSALYKRNLRTYKDPWIAAYHTQKQLVDYHAISPATEAARTIMPFATWRTAMPAAVGKSIAEHPERANFLNRASGGALSGQQFTDSKGNKHKFSNPVAEAGELTGGFGGVGKYATGALSMTSKVGTDALVRLLAERYRTPRNSKTLDKIENAATYGKDPITYLLHSLPILSQIQELTGRGLFGGNPLDALRYQLTGVETLP